MPGTRAARPAHPRSRGEHRSSSTVIPRMVGSSPLARGTYLEKFAGSRVTRLIPARAGNIAQSSPCTGFHAAHPRSRGEHECCAPCLEELLGSSPLARGTYRGFCEVAALDRLIPARAGNMCCFRRRRHNYPAHPRSRGEHPLPSFLIAWLAGSSPLARGT